MKMLESIVERNALADKSWEFLLAFDLLAKDLDSFYRHFSLVDPPYSCAEEVPVHYQEAFVMKWLRSNDASVLSGGFVSAEMADKARAFRECLLSNQSPSAIKQKTAYAITLSLVGSEMCIRDRLSMSIFSFH